MDIVLGLGFGDEGKGLTTSFLCNQNKIANKKSLVVRFSGGQQAGHTVTHNGKRHVFSNFGSGTLQGNATYWSEYCTFSPIGVLNEYNALKEIKGLTPELYVNPLSPVTTPFDKHFNCTTEKKRNHGSCGVGVGATIQRQEDYYKLFVQDLFHPGVLYQKLMNIKYYYEQMGFSTNVDLGDFLYVIDKVKDIITVDNGDIMKGISLIFEGSQGILLDQDFGFFPNVTRSNTTSKNAFELIKKHQLPYNPINLQYPSNAINIYYITRAYQTRHGNGFMTNENISAELKLTNTEDETNVTNEYQGDFRKSVLDLDLLKYALQCDSNFSSGARKNLVITCIDQVGETIPVTMQDGKNKVLHHIPVKELHTFLGVSFDAIYLSRGPSLHDMSVIKISDK